MQMQDPTQGVPPQLLPHVHLISAHKYPPYHQFSEAQAYNLLFEAPKVVKQIAPMQWQYLTGPHDGTVFLTWIGGRMQTFASDGYVWADQEHRYSQDFGGYTLEIAVHNSGYRPGIDQVSSHARRRYRFVSKNPTVSALPPDPSLWVVHYSQADPQNCVPVSQVMVTPHIRAQLNERQWIEQQGRLEQQAFMLHDRDKWPHLNMPGRGGLPGPMYNPGMHAQNPMAHVGNPRFSGQFYQQQAAAAQAAAGPSPAKRQRQHPPSQMPASAAALMATDTSIEDEENVLAGDILDHLTQRDISLTRYMQHHEWMEEVFSSPYATGKIIPADLGFGLMGELAGLTDGLMDLPAKDQDQALAKKDSSTENAYKKVTPEQLQEFEKRVKAHMEKGQAELEKMKEDHAKKMAGLKKSKTILQAEKRLRMSMWDPTEAGNEVWRLDRAGLASGESTRPKESADDIIKEVETALDGTIKPQKEASLVDRGGLREKVAAPPPPPPPPANGDSMNGSAGDVNMQMDGAFDQNDATAQSQPQFGQQPTITSEQQPQSSLPATQQQPQQQAQSQHPSTQQFDDATMDNNEAMMDDSLMDDLNMDMDVDTSALNFDDSAEPSPRPASSSNTWQQTQQQQQQPQGIQAPQPQQQQQPSSLSTSTSAPTNQAQTQPGDQSNQTNTPDMFAPSATTIQTSTAGPASAAANINTSTSTPANDASDTAFGDFDTGDGLIDFDAGEADDMGFDMDNSAFGDAFHGTEAHGDGGEGAAS